jgi:hypothetical protein
MYLRLGLVLLVIFGGRQCDFTVGNLGDLVVTYDITVVNSSAAPAIVGIYGGDVKRRAVVTAGTSVTATSFKGGSVLISVSPAEDVLAHMKARRDQIAAKVDAKPLDLSKSIEIYNQLNQVNAEIRSFESEQHGSLCTVALKTDSKGKGVNVSFTATIEGSRFILACS